MPSVNMQGHAKTLVASQPVNGNALKAGVFSPRTIAPRVQELDAQMAQLSAAEIRERLLRYEVAALLALGERMDESLDAGLQNARGEPRTLVNLRLRLDEKLRQALKDLHDLAASEAAQDLASDGSGFGSFEDLLSALHEAPPGQMLAAHQI